MVDETSLVLDTDHGLGEIVIAPEVIEVIIGIAASKVDGIHRMQASFTNNVTELLGRSVYGKGVHLTIDEEGIKVDLYVNLKYGVSVPKVAMQVQSRVKQQVLFMTDIELDEVNVHVVSLVPEKTEQLDLEELFENDEAENE